MTSPSDFSELTVAVLDCGFAVRGGFHVRPADGFPAGVASAVLVGHIGAREFARFRRSPEWAMVADPLDRYTERVITALARQFGARVVFPHQGPPWWPFQRWAMRAEVVFPSPLQILIHPQHGLWHAYRAALMFAAPLAGLADPPVASRSDPRSDSAPDPAQNPCVQCQARPCLSACPVDAFGEHGFDSGRCAGHLRSAAGRSCVEQGCAARNACPVAPLNQYGVEQQQFHMRAFVASPAAATRSAMHDNDDEYGHE